MAINLNKIRGDRAYRFVVREGDTLSSLSELLGVEQNALRAANPDLDLDRLVPGTDLVIPEAKAVDEAPAESGEAVTPSAPVSDAVSSAVEDASKEAPGDDPDAPGSVHEEAVDEADHYSSRAADANRPKVIALRVNEHDSAPADGSEIASPKGEEEAAPAGPDLQPDAPIKSAPESRDAAETQSVPSRFEPVSWKPFPKV